MVIPGKHRIKKLSGFTLIELLVTLALIGMVLIMGNLVYSIFSQQQAKYMESLSLTAEQNTLWNDLRYELQFAHGYEFPSETELLLLNESGDPFCHYRVDAGRTLKIRQADIDTINSAWEAVATEDSRRFYLQDSSGLAYLFLLPFHGNAIPPLSNQPKR